MEYTTKDGDTVKARGLTLTVELSEKTKNEIVSQAVARMQEATETLEKLSQALAEADAENAKLKQLVYHMYTCMEQVDGFGVYYDCENCSLKDKCDECGLEERVRAFGIEVDE
jgi:hypothetical protein